MRGFYADSCECEGQVAAIPGSTCLRPYHPLLCLRDRAYPLVHEPLDARAGVGFGRVEISFRIGREIVDAKELSRTTSAIAERSQHLE